MFEDTLAQILDLERKTPAASLPAALDELFARLAAAPADGGSYAIEDAIWEIWTGHADPALAALMNQAIAAIASNRFDEAAAVLCEMTAKAPEWAEAWNKRATLDYLRGRDAEAVAAIGRALALEPRHFGAIAGFAQICLRNGDPHSARLAFEACLRINPHLSAVRIAVEELRRTHPSVLH